MALGKSSPQITLASTLQRAGLVPIGNGIYLRREIPPSKSFSDATIYTKSFNPLLREPNIILVFGWMGAKLPHILKYTKVYEDMYPNATQIIVQSEPHFFWSSKRTRMNNLVPVAEVLEAHGCNGTRQESPSRDDNPPRILVHSFSNGGGLQMYTLGNLLRARLGSSSSSCRPSSRLSAVVIDSCPGNASFRGAIQAFTAALPKNSPLRIPVIIFITLLYGFGIIRHRIFGVQPIFERLKEALLRKGPEGGILPWMTEKTPRMYICSKKDELTPVEQIEEHVKEAKYRGLNAQIVVYEDTPHVGHARRYPEQYWGAVKDLWTQAVEGQ
ncbi:hypothetical protein C8R41DRAFT_806576 [Lentinula lateritia]|uniref:Indole-diterpene biosynthesis protein PaxU n=1 Tax=Lentinula lateritia TaxID=40482 RepID=A0ABQ8VZ14_9AGAR|nr:hypothetical protein C8R41DRAFT_806576 [Lentinula lateritia]